MGYFSIFLTGVGLSMDAFAVSVCKGLGIKRFRMGSVLIPGLYFGVFQALMPLLGYLLGAQFKEYIQAFDHWIAFVLLGVIGANMIREALKGDEACPVSPEENELSFKVMAPLAVATSIDALAVGITFAFLKVKIVPAILMIGVTTFTLSCIGVKIGNVFGMKFKKKAELAGGVILILIGLRILLDHLGVI
ncbi:putative Mn2+ efflux pump MntP [Lachnospiraceae bacterium PF1-21]|uniref:manganese efflux pump MntP n=1 Tax=Ohessyouella blattaphilus TaxID=2949333 RepID=UPI003E24B652